MFSDVGVRKKMNTKKVFIFLSIWRTKKMNKDYIFIFFGVWRTKKMASDQSPMSTRKRGCLYLRNSPFLFVVGESFIPWIGRSWLIDSLLGVRIR